MAPSQGPSVSVVIPVYNDPAGIRDTLSSILESTDSDLLAEVLVVDNGSTDETADVVREYEATHEVVTLVVEAEVQGSYAARNAGIEAATGGVLTFVDADVTVTADWLRTALDELDASGSSYVAPDVRLVVPEEPTRAARYNETAGFPNEDFVAHHRYTPTACLFVRRELIDAVGPFDSRLVSGGDMEFGNRVADAGYDLRYTPRVVVYHPVRESVGALVRRNVRIGRGHCQLQRYYPDRYGRVGIPPRPSGITGDQYDGAMNWLTFTALDLTMTLSRAAGYYRECLATVFGRFRR